MTLPAELETSVAQLRAKHTDLVTAVNNYLSGTVTSSKQDLLDMAYSLHDRIAVEEKALLGQIARKGRMPSLELDFVNGKYGVGPRRIESFSALQNILTFTRSTGGGRFNEQGLYEWVAADVPRLDYDPVTKVCRGLLVEEQRTNLLTYSGDFSNSAWVKTSVTATAGAASPDGLNTAFSLVASAGTAASVIVNQTEVTAGATHTQTYIVKAGVLRYIQIAGSTGFSTSTFVNFDLVLGTITRNDTSAAASIKPLGDGWYSCSLTLTSNASQTRGQVALFLIENATSSRGSSFTSDGASGVYIWGAQLEVGSFPTSYIPTAGTAVTRAADGMQHIFGNELAKNSGTLLYCVAMQPRPGFTGVSGNPYVLGTAQAPYLTASLNRQDGYSRFVGYDGVGSSSIAVMNDTSTGWLHNEQTILAHAWEHRPAENTRSTVFAIKGVLRKIEGSYSPEVSKIDRIKAVPGDTQHIKFIRYIPRRLTDEELQELTQ